MNQYFKNLEIIQRYGEPSTPEIKENLNEEKPYVDCIRCGIRLVEEEESEGVCNFCKEVI